MACSRSSCVLVLLSSLLACTAGDETGATGETSTGTSTGSQPSVPTGGAEPSTGAGTDLDTDLDTESSGQGDTTGTATGGSGTQGTGDTEGSPSGILELESVLDINAVVATKGMDVDSQGNVFLWNYNQDNLERYDGAMLQTLVVADFTTSFGTDLSVDSDGDVVVSRGGSAVGESLMKWDGTTGAPLWGDEGVLIPDALLLGLTHATVGGSEDVYVCDGAATGSSIHRLARADGAVLQSVPVDDIPLDVAVDGDENYYVLASTSSNPVVSGDPVQLRKYDATGTVIAGPVELSDAIYITLADNGLLYVSSTDFDEPTRSILSFTTELTPLSVTTLPPEYEGFAGGITSVGSGDDMRVFVTAQEGVGSGPICDVLVYREP